MKINVMTILEDRARAKNLISNNFIGEFVLHENLLGKSFNIGHILRRKKNPNDIIQPPVSRKLKN